MYPVILSIDWVAVGSIGALLNAVVLVVGFWFAAQQLRVSARSVTGQTFLAVQERARLSDLSGALDYVRSLSFSDYPAFLQRSTKEQRAQVRSVIDFFNDLEHLVRLGLLDRGTVNALYTPSMETCAYKLYPWWVDGFRAAQRSALGNGHAHAEYLYETFEGMCQRVLAAGGAGLGPTSNTVARAPLQP